MPARVLYDGHNLALQTGTGIATYARNLIGSAKETGYHVSIAYSVSERPPEDPTLREIELFEDRPGRPRKFDTETDWIRAQLGLFRRLPLLPVTGSGVVLTGPLGDRLPAFDDLYVGQHVFHRARRHFAAKGTLAELDLEPRPDLAHFTFPTPLRVPKAINVQTIHDLVPMRLPYATLGRKDRFCAVHRAIAASADHIVTVSEASRRDIVRWLGVPEERVTNTYQSVSVPEALRRKSADQVADEIGGLYGLDYGGYFLFFGAIEPKKNVLRLLEAFLSSGLDRPLVVVSSSGWQNERELEIIGNKWFQRRGLAGAGGRRPKIKPIAYAPYRLLVSLIRGARAVTFPSLYEGFGLPILEAMLLGTPVLTSNTSSLPEVAGDAALLVDPTDTDEIRRGLRTLAQDDDLCRELSRRGVAQAEKFSAERYRQRILALYSGLGLSPGSA